MSQAWYFCGIRTLISNRCAATRVTLPTNRRILNAFIESSEMHFVENLLSGFREFKQWDYTDWDSDVTFLKFKDHIIDDEPTRMEKNLEPLKYCIDDTNTLTSCRWYWENRKGEYWWILLMFTNTDYLPSSRPNK